MESKEKLYEIIANAEKDRSEYLNKIFKYMPEAIAKEFVYTEAKQGDYIIRAGESCESVYILLKGDVRGEDYLKMGRAYSFMDFTRMYIVGDFELFSDHPESCISVRASEKCKMLKISAGNYLRWIQHDENALMLRLKSILKILMQEKKVDRENMVVGCPERLSSFLTKFYDREAISSVSEIKVDLTQTELADKVGFNVRSVQRGISTLEQNGMLSVTKGKISISAEQYALLKQYEAGKKEGTKHGKI